MQVSKFKNLPKIELHLHLDCSLSYDVVKKIDPTVDLNHYKSSFQAGESCSSLKDYFCLLYTSPSPRDRQKSRMPSSA